MLPANLWSFAWHFLKEHKHVVALYVFIAFCTGFWAPFNGLLVKYIIDTLSGPHSISALILPGCLLVLNFIVFDNITWRSLGYLNYKFRPIIKYKIVNETFSFILGCSQQFFQDNLSGRIANQITTLADNLERILHNITADLIRCASLLTISFISMYYVDSRFCLTLGIWFVIFSSFSIYMSKRLVALSDAHTESESAISGQLVDSISNASTVRIFARRFFEILRMEKSLLYATKKFRKKEIFIVVLNSVEGGMIAIMMGFMVYFLIDLYENELVSLGDFALIIGLSMEVGHISWYTMSQIEQLNQAVGKCKQSLSQLIVEHDIKDKENATELVVKDGEIIFANVKFHYKDITPLFQDKSVTIAAGQKIGLVGYSGSGKSTFVNLILRLYDVTEGQILIDGQNISEYTQDSLRESIAMIPQDPTLFHRSLMENIRYGRTDASDAEVVKAAKRAHAHEFITKLPMGYDSPVGERGVKLSGGQRQRIAIARAILKRAPILILDEATSQLDSVTENDIQESLQDLMQDKTTIVIAHRLSTLLQMDRILVFDQGKIVEDGNHKELIAKKGLYKKLWDAQVGGFLPDEKK